MTRRLGIVIVSLLLLAPVSAWAQADLGMEFDFNVGGTLSPYRPLLNMANAPGPNPLEPVACYTLKGNLAYAADCANFKQDPPPPGLEPSEGPPGTVLLTPKITTDGGLTWDLYPEDPDCPPPAGYLYFEVLSQSPPPSRLTGITFNGIDIEPDEIEQLSGSPCFPQTFSTFYMADVTGLVFSGQNVVTGLPNNGGASFFGNITEGASLYVIYCDNREPVRDICVYHGGALNNDYGEFMEQTMTGFESNGLEATLYTHIGNGNPNFPATCQACFGGSCTPVGDYCPWPDGDKLDGDACHTTRIRRALPRGGEMLFSYMDDDSYFDFTSLAFDGATDFSFKVTTPDGFGDCLDFVSYALAVTTNKQQDHSLCGEPCVSCEAWCDMVECEEGGTTLTCMGVGDTNQIDTPLLYTWQPPPAGCLPLDDGDQPTHRLDCSGTGHYNLSLQVTLDMNDDGVPDSDEPSGLCLARGTVLDTVAPAAVAPPDVLTECTMPEGAQISLVASGTDACTGLTIDHDCQAGSGAVASGVYPIGATRVCWDFFDGGWPTENHVMDCTNVEVQDTVGPDIRLKPGMEESCLWSPNHKYVGFNLSDFVDVISDVCDPDPRIFATCESSQPDNLRGTGGGDGETEGDCLIVADSTLDFHREILVRSERMGRGRGNRIYTFTVWAMDASKNEGDPVQFRIVVPHNAPAGECVSPEPARLIQ